MRISFQHAAVHKCAGVALIGVAADKFLHIAAVAGSKLPFETRGESCAAAAAQAGVQNHLDDLVRSHFDQHLAQSHIAFAGDVLVNLLWVDDAAVAQGHANLLFIKIGVVQIFDAFRSNGFIIDQARHRTAFEQVLLHDLMGVLRLDHSIEDIVRVDDHHRAKSAQAMAAGFHHADFLIQPCRLDLLCQRFNYFLAAAGRTARAAADQYMCTIHLFFPPPLTDSHSAGCTWPGSSPSSDAVLPLLPLSPASS